MNPLPLRLAVLFLFLAGAGLSGCLYANVRGPWSYRSATPSDVKSSMRDARVTGTACNRSVLYLVAWGDAGYAAAVGDALKLRPDAFLYDVKSDIKTTSVLFGLYTRICTTVTGRLGEL